MLTNELITLSNYISRDISGTRKLFYITQVDVKKSTIYISFDDSNGTKTKIVYPINKDILKEEVNISGLMYPTSSLNMKTKIPIEELCKILSTFYVGIWDKKQKYINVSPTPEEFVNSYRSMTIEDFEENKVGLSWDYTNYIKKYLSKHYPELKPEQYLLETDNFGSSFHAFVVYEENNKYCLIETIYKNHLGIHSFNSLDSLFEYVMTMVSQTEAPTKIYRYKNITSGMNIIDIVDEIENKGVLVFER